MRGFPSPKYWKLTALLALIACGVLLWRSPEAAATHGAAYCEPADVRRGAGFALEAARMAPGDAPSEDALAPLLAEVARATGVRARCRALLRLARGGGAQAFEPVFDYTAASQPSELRVCATAALEQVDSPEVLASLLELIEDRRTEVVEAAARALAQRGDQESLAALIDAAESAEPPLSATLAIALAEVGAPQAIALIDTQLEHGSLRDRDRLIMALGSGGIAGALPLLEKLAGSGVASVQYTAINALGELGGADAANALLRLMQRRPALAPMLTQALARTGDQVARKSLVELAEGEQNRNVSVAALQALVGFDDGAVHTLMTRTLSSSDPNRVNMAMEYFANHPDPIATARLIELARKSSPHTGYAALNALGRSEDPRARAVIEELARGNGQLKSPALMALAAQPGGAELARELALLQVKQGGTQIHQAIELLANDDSPEARAALIAVARRNDQSSSMALSWLGQRGDRESVSVLEEVVSSAGNGDTRATAMYALVQSGDPGASKVLMRALQTGDANTRSQAVSALAQVAGPEVEQALLSASRDKESSVAAQAASALGQLGSPAALARVEELARGSDINVTRHAIMTLMATPERAAPIARSLASSSDRDARMLAVEVAGGLGSEAGKEILLAGLRDSDRGVASVALSALGAYNDATTRAAIQAVAQNGALAGDLRVQASQLLKANGVSEPDEE